MYATRIDAACEELGTNWKDMHRVLKETGIGLDRKMLSTLAIYEPYTFKVSFLTWTLLVSEGLLLGFL